MHRLNNTIHIFWRAIAILMIDLCEYHQFYELLGHKRLSFNSKRNRRLKCRRDSDDSHSSFYIKSNRSFVELFCLGRVKGS